MSRQNLKYFCFSCHQKLSNEGECVTPDCEEHYLNKEGLSLVEGLELAASEEENDV